VQAVRTKPPAAVGGASSRAKKGGKKGGKKGKSCPDCQYVAKVFVCMRVCVCGGGGVEEVMCECGCVY
jgi:hypothetical protein